MNCHGERGGAAGRAVGAGPVAEQPSRAAPFAVEAPQNRLYAPRSIWAPDSAPPARGLGAKPRWKEGERKRRPVLAYFVFLRGWV
jgi:hypothetical protein